MQTSPGNFAYAPCHLLALLASGAHCVRVILASPENFASLVVRCSLRSRHLLRCRSASEGFALSGARCRSRKELRFAQRQVLSGIRCAHVMWLAGLAVTNCNV